MSSGPETPPRGAPSARASALLGRLIDTRHRDAGQSTRAVAPALLARSNLRVRRRQGAAPGI